MAGVQDIGDVSALAGGMLGPSPCSLAPSYTQEYRNTDSITAWRNRPTQKSTKEEMLSLRKCHKDLTIPACHLEKELPPRPHLQPDLLWHWDSTAPPFPPIRNQELTLTVSWSQGLFKFCPKARILFLFPGMKTIWNGEWKIVISSVSL